MHSAEFKKCIEAPLNSNSSLEKSNKQRERVRTGKKKKPREVRDKTQHSNSRELLPKGIYADTEDSYC